MTASDASTSMYGHRLVPALVDQIANENPERLYASFPRSTDRKDDFVDIRFKQFAGFIDQAAFWLEEVLSDTEDVVAYIGPSDLRYHVLITAASKIGVKILLPSPRNTVEAQHRLFDATHCSVLLHDAHIKVDQIVRGHESTLRSVAVWSLDEMLELQLGRHYPYNKTFDQGKLDPFVILHTSGSTGVPKPVQCPLGWAASVDAKNAHSGVDSLKPQPEYIRGKRLLCVLPFFHAGGIAIGFLGPIFYDYSIIIPYSGVPPSVPLVEDMLDACKPDMMYLAPSMLEELVQSPDGLARLAKLAAVGWTGGPLAHHIGEEIRTVTGLINTCGTTEILWAPTLQHSTDARFRDEDWQYHFFDPAMEGVQFRDRGDDIYEQFLVRHPSTDSYHAAWWTFPNLEELPMHDLYAKHPTRPNYWKHVGRSDDILVFSNGEKINPVDMESVLQDSELIKGALIVGQGRFHSAALIELSQGSHSLAEADIIDRIWSYVEEANHHVPAHGQLVSKEHIIIAAPEKPFPRAGKGTIQRKAAVQLFAPEIESLYVRNVEDPLDVRPPSTLIDLRQSTEHLTASILQLIEKVLGVEGLTVDTDIFSAGLDSLGVMRLAKQMNSGIKVGSAGLEDLDILLHSVNNRLIYTNPTARKMATALENLSKSMGVNAHAPSDDNRLRAMRQLLERYSEDLPPAPVPSNTVAGESTNHDMTVVLTGSSGSLGSYILHSLLTRSKQQIRKTYCLNRSIDAAKIQFERHTARGLETGFDRVEFLAVDVGAPHLGLEQKDYNRLLLETTYIIHNQWQVNFNLAVESFEPQIAGVRHLIDLATASPNRPPILFTSSISTVTNWNVQNGSSPVPESAIADWTVSDAQGYGESKFISEKLLETAGQTSQVCSVICKIGQIAGPVTKGDQGQWNKQEWLPSLIASSKFLRMIPESLSGLDDVKWTPVDTTADIIVEMMEASDKLDKSSGWTKHYNLVNPSSGRWSDLVPRIQKHFQQQESEMHLAPVSFPKWMEAVQSNTEENSNFAANPALKLVDFYRDLAKGGHSAQFETSKAEAVSKSMGSSKPVSDEWMDIWLRQWRF